MRERMEAGSQGGGEAIVGCAMVVIGALLLAACLFLDRADDYFYGVAENRLIEYGAIGPGLVALIVLAVLFSVLSLVGPMRRVAPAFVLAATIACLVLTIVAATDLGTHPTDAGFQSNSIAIGSLLAIAASMVMAAGSLVLLGSGSLGDPRKSHG